VKRSVDRILTTHVGSLPRPNHLVELYRDNTPDGKLLPRLRSAIAEVLQRQSQCGIDIVNDGEFGKAMRRSLDFGAWWSYVYDRLAGFEVREEAAKKGRAAWTFGSKERAARNHEGPSRSGRDGCGGSLWRSSSLRLRAVISSIIR
jgi:methionine synthase II (cobalamin-independent)